MAVSFRVLAGRRLLLLLFLASQAGCELREKTSAESAYALSQRLLDADSPEYNAEDGAYWLSRAIELEPTQQEFRRERAFLSFDRSNFAAALSDLIVACPPSSSDNYTCHYILGLTLGRLGRYAEARTALKAAIAIEPDNNQYRNALALAYLSLGQLEDGLTAIAPAIAAENGVSQWRYTKGVILSRLSRKKEAVQTFSETTAYTLATKTGLRDVFYDGEREYQRARAMSLSDLQQLWHYGFQWMPVDVEKDYSGPRSE